MKRSLTKCETKIFCNKQKVDFSDEEKYQNQRIRDLYMEGRDQADIFVNTLKKIKDTPGCKAKDAASWSSEGRKFLKALGFDEWIIHRMGLRFDTQLGERAALRGVLDAEEVL